MFEFRPYLAEVRVGLDPVIAGVRSASVEVAPQVWGHMLDRQYDRCWSESGPRLVSDSGPCEPIPTKLRPELPSGGVELGQIGADSDRGVVVVGLSAPQVPASVAQPKFASISVEVGPMPTRGGVVASSTSSTILSDPQR